MNLLATISHYLGTDPITLIVIGAVSGICAHFMKHMLTNPWLMLVYWPLLLAGGLATDDLAVALGLYPPVEVSLVSDFDLLADWSAVNANLPNVLLYGTAGMCITALCLICLTRLAEPRA